ncbi:UDP-N-acetylmuramoylalanine--D-glutamate ligase [Mariprofundus ferrinatatus]|uniref:UDP-N-acetylmuramoylalanine--D-glutamate ligase n=2 Tax=Mariprofundus ferrinatatus TaxID=1921087 RepID=A0A2K8L5T9_9PROT|nr:UDP-N-acetylmuramoylalanine--D-glutamate ligase [Mariprofundus ferrinatatus]
MSMMEQHTGSDHDRLTAVIGMGKTGQSAAAFLLHHGLACEAFDEKRVEVPRELDMPLHIGKLKAADLQRFSRIIVSPGVNWNHPALVEARNSGVPMYGDLQLFGEQYHGNIIAVTGTNGKTTTVSLIGTLLDTLPGGIEAGGNIGTPMLDLLGDEEPARVVLELSSFQLERAAPIRPRWAALLNIQPDHADMHADAAAYRAAKLRLFANQGEGDKAMLPCDVEWDALADELRGRGVYVRRFGVGYPETMDCGVQMLPNGSWQLFWHHYEIPEFISSDELPSRGVHQHLNLAVAAQAATDFGVSISVVRQALTSFRGLPHRLQSLGIVAGREWLNDSKATNPDAAIAALKSFHQVVWICGGLRKGLDVSVLKEAVASHVEHVYIIGKDPKPFVELADAAGVPATFAKTMEQAVKLASRSQAGLSVLLSPAAASQDQFANYAERGNAFVNAVKALEAKA